MVSSLLQNLAMLFAMGILYAMAASRFELRTTRGELLSGVLFGTITLGVMWNHFDVGYGVIFDARSIVLACAGAFGGPVAAMVAATIAAAGRLYIGGSGLLTGLGVILSSTAIGVAGHRWRRTQDRQPTWFELLALGFAVHLAMQLCMLLLPETVRAEAWRAILPYTLGAFPLMTMVMGLLLVDVENRDATARRLARVNRAYRTLSESNRWIGRAKDEAAMVSRICELLVTVGGHDAACVNLAEDGTLKRRGRAGDDVGYLAFIDRGDAEHDEPTTLSFRSGAAILHQAETNGASSRAWIRAAEQAGFPTILALPLRFESETLGVLTLFGRRPQAFDDEEIHLIEELARDLALGIGTLRLRVAEASARAERERFESLLGETEERYRQLVEMAPDGIAIHDAHELLYINRAGLDILGAKDPTQVLGRPVDALMRPDWRQRAEEQLGVLRSDPGSSPGAYQDESYLRRVDGALVPVEIAVRGVLYKGRPAVQAVIRDISLRREAEAALRRQQELFQRVFADIPTMLCLADASGQNLVVNDALTRTLGWTADERGVEGLFERCFPNPIYRAQVEDLLDAEDEDWHALEVATTDGECVESTWRSVELSDGTRLFIGLDHTAMRQVEAERDAFKAQLYQSQKMEAVGRLAGGVAHDFNNLLTVINSYAELASAGLREEDPMREDLEEVKRAGLRAAGLTRQLLAFSRKQLLRPKVVDPNGLIEDMERMLQRIIGEDIALTTSLTPEVGQIKVDPGQLEQVVLNLAVNSRDAMPTGGQIVIRTAPVSATEAAAARLPHAPLGYVQIAVTDTGEGMDDAVKERLFEPFFTTKEAHKGTGLGLSTAYGIVTQSGGDIRVQSTKGEGATFTVYLPRCAAPRLVSRDEAHEPLPRGSETVLVVEDEEAVRGIARRILERSGYRVLTAANGMQARNLLDEQGETIDLLLTDVVMPGMSGRELADVVSQTHPTLEILYMTGYTDDAILRHGTLNEGVRLITKPFTADGLVRAVREALDARKG